MAVTYATPEEVAHAMQTERWAVIEKRVQHDETIVETFPTEHEAQQVADDLNGWVAVTSNEMALYHVGQLHPPLPESPKEETREL